MGQAILYCFRCSSQLREAQFEKGKAFRIDSFVSCSGCAPELAKILPPERLPALQDLLSGKERKPSSATPPPLRDARLSITPASFPPAPVPENRFKWPLIVGLAVAAVVLLIVAMMSSDRTPRPEPAAAPEPVATPRPGPLKPPPPVVPPESPEREALKRARKYAREHPDDLEGQLREFNDLGLLSDKTEIGVEARRAMEDLQARERQLVARGLEALQNEIEGPLQREEYGTVNRALEAAKLRIPGMQWKLAVEKRQREVGERVHAALQRMIEKAKVAKSTRKQAELDALLATVRSWEGSSLETLERVLAAVEVPPPPIPEAPARSPEGNAYLAQWERAMAKAAARDYAAAAAELERAAAPLKEDAVRQEAARDVRDLKDLDRLYQAAILAPAASKPRALRTIDGRSLSGRVLAADADRVELVVDAEKTVFLEWSEVAAATILELMKPQQPDARLTALFGLLEGDARAYCEGVDPKYGAFAAVARKLVAPPSADELNAREIYYDAERQYRKMSTRDKAIEGYRLLKQKYKDSVLVRHAAARIDRRIDSGKEYYFLSSDLAAGGTFSLTKEGRYESLADVDPAKATPNWVEWEFLALPSTTYRCWALVGGCCAEAFTLHVQATGLTAVHPKSKKSGPAEPGGELSSPLKHSLKNLKPSHPKGEPQKPLRWEWLEVPLPRLSSGGVRKARLLTDLQGVGVAAVLVSASKSKAPVEAETAELARVRALDAVPSWFGSKPVGIPRLALDDFDKSVAGWGFHNGAEFPGAKGALVHDPAVGHEEKGSLRLSCDFNGGGSYVSGGRSFPAGADIKELRFWLKSDTAVHLGIRVGDGSDQCLQKPWPLAATREWQEVVLPFAKFNGAEHWGGANDGKLHTPVKWFHICISKTTFGGAKTGEIWIDDVEAILNSDSPDAGK